nr:cell division protein CrgA [Rudaeicoccus suwonensis]
MKSAKPAKTAKVAKADASAKRPGADVRAEKRAVKVAAGPNASWFVPTMCGFMLVGLFWLVTYYLSQEDYPIPGIGLGNMVIGFVLILIGFGMTTRWR